jgi:transposase-like protein
LRPFLEEKVPLAQVARDAGIDLSTAHRWIKHYRKHGLAGLVRKARSDKAKSQMSVELRHAIEGLALKQPAAFRTEAQALSQ